MKKIDVKLRNSYNNCILRKIIYHQYLPMLIGISDQMGAQTDRLRCEVCQNLILSPMNTGLLRPAVTTVLTVHGIETCHPFHQDTLLCPVTTVLTVHGIETRQIIDPHHKINPLQQSLPFTVLKLSVLRNS